MSNEIKYGSSMALTNGTLTDGISASGLVANQTNARLVRNVQTLAVSSAEGDLISLGGVVVPGIASFSNLDTANYLEIGIQVTGTFYPFIKLKAGQQSGPLFLGTSAIYGRANTADVKLFYVIYDS